MDEPKDLRSTGRKRARWSKLIWLAAQQPPLFACESCGRAPTKIPANLPPSLSPNSFVLPAKDLQAENVILDVDHINKDLTDFDPANLSLLCRSCHKNSDLTTAKGESKVEDEYGYRLARLKKLLGTPMAKFSVEVIGVTEDDKEQFAVDLLEALQNSDLAEQYDIEFKVSTVVEADEE